MEYAFVYNGTGYTPSGKLVLAEKRVPSHNAECEAADLAALEAGQPIVVYPKHDTSTRLNHAAVSYGPAIVTLWAGVEVGHVCRMSTFRNPFGGTLTAYTWRDTHGKLWHGRGSGAGMALISRRSKV